MGNRSRLVVKEEKAQAAPAPPADDQEEKDPNILREKLYRTRLELQRMMALSAKADQTICRLTAEAHKAKQERDKEYVKYNALLAELQARRNAQVMMTTPAAAAGNRALVAPAPFGRMATHEQYYAQCNRALMVPAPFGPMNAHEQYYAQAAGVSYVNPAPTSGSPAAAFAGSWCYRNPALMVPAPFGRMTTQDYAQAAGVSYCFPSSSPRLFDSFVPAAATGIMPGTAGKKRSGSELDLVVQQMLRLSRKKVEVVEAPVHEEVDNDADAGTTSSEKTVSDAGLTEVGGGECSLADSAASRKQ